MKIWKKKEKKVNAWSIEKSDKIAEKFNIK